MSRPFSYNDENFTVIGNVLFIHFMYEKSAPINTRLIEIPPAICDRLLFYSCFASTVYKTKDSNAGQLILTVTEYNGKCYFANLGLLKEGTGRYVYGNTLLKDI